MNAISRHWDIVKAALEHEKERAKAPFRTDETAFLPAALEVIETPVSPTGRVTTWVLLVGLALTLAWLCLGKLDVVSSAPGKIIPAENVKLIQPADTGVVRKILVDDGQTVKAGQVLVELDPTISTADAEQARKALQTAELSAARDRAILSALDGKGLRFIAPPGTDPDIAQTAIDLARAKVEEIEATDSTDVANRDAAAAAYGEATTNAAKLTETLPLLDEQIAANEQLLAKGYVSKLKVIEMQRQRLGAAKDRDAALDTAARARAQMAGAASGGAESRANARATVLADLSQAEADARQHREELVRGLQRAGQQQLVSPVDGIVTGLAVHTVGGVVEATKPIMIIVPIGGKLVLEAKVLNRDVGFVRPGLPAAVKLDAFPFMRYGTIPGTVTSVSSDATADEKLGLIYTAEISLDKSSIVRDGQTIALIPGMSATVDVKTGRRSVMSYLLSPIEATTMTAGRER